ncbi:MAG: DDE-type integrase/transposase/recombinase [Candidatus Yanofskybacteria bacterium]|nr:DDE-type integrase/transposase/recombinase [Candidatus Yanofskybacteria bacterium]
MSYTKNPYLPRVRRDAADLVRRGWGVRKVARYVGVSPGTITKWVKKAKIYGYRPIPTLSSRPNNHPKQLTKEMIANIVLKRQTIKRSAEVIYQELINEGIKTSLSSVKRTLDRFNLLKKRSPWKRYHAPTLRPNVEKQGDLVQIDTIHLLTPEGQRVYVFTLLDVYSRWAYARAYRKSDTRTALNFVRQAEKIALFSFKVLQSDHGSEFSRKFSEHICSIHRHSRVRRPNDNAHLERFNRTIQEECLDKVSRTVKDLNSAIKKYIPYYNEKRLHFGLKLQTPNQILMRKCFQAID